MKQILHQKDIQQALSMYLGAIGLQNISINSLDFRMTRGDDGLTATIDYDIDTANQTAINLPDAVCGDVEGKSEAVDVVDTPTNTETPAEPPEDPEKAAPVEPESKPKKKLFAANPNPNA